MIDILYEIFVTETWIITIPVSIWFIALEKFFNTDHIANLIIFAFAIALTCHMTLFFTGNQPDLIKCISDTIYDTITPIGVYTLYQLIFKKKLMR